MQTLLGGCTVLSTLVSYAVHTMVLHKPLGSAEGFTILALFSNLRPPLEDFPENLAYFLRARVSLTRIESFLNTPDVRGLHCKKLPPTPPSTTSNTNNGGSISDVIDTRGGRVHI